MINQIIYIFAMRLIAFDGVDRQSITQLSPMIALKNARHTVKRCRVSFFNLTIQSPYRWLVKGIAQLQAILVGSDKYPYWVRESFPGGAFSFSFLLLVFF
ncbi:hypothetical protein LCGC14_0388210 [marine sediment metagenome]|uniref:Uncharacterized protein n=1 Tax=marine sediment metagenome TaxID=412755 RepID=A0A0F9T5V6_9ZZZZ